MENPVVYEFSFNGVKSRAEYHLTPSQKELIERIREMRSCDLARLESQYDQAEKHHDIRQRAKIWQEISEVSRRYADLESRVWMVLLPAITMSKEKL